MQSHEWTRRDVAKGRKAGLGRTAGTGGIADVQGRRGGAEVRPIEAFIAAIRGGCFTEGFRAPALSDGGAMRRGRRSKASQGGNRGEVGAVWRARLWGFEDRGRLASEASAAGDARCFHRKRRRRTFLMAAMRGSEALRVGRRRDWRPRADIALVFRRAAGGGGDRRCEAGCAATVMRCRS